MAVRKQRMVGDASSGVPVVVDGKGAGGGGVRYRIQELYVSKERYMSRR